VINVQILYHWFFLHGNNPVAGADPCVCLFLRIAMAPSALRHYAPGAGSALSLVSRALSLSKSRGMSKGCGRGNLIRMLEIATLLHGYPAGMILRLQLEITVGRSSLRQSDLGPTYICGYTLHCVTGTCDIAMTIVLPFPHEILHSLPACSASTAAMAIRLTARI
jgi:hypothetical protein